MIALMLLLLRLAPVCPVDGASVTSEFGMRDHPIVKRRKLHRGIDFGAAKGTLVKSIWPGTVVTSRSTSGGYGRIVVVETGHLRVLYAHLSRRSVRQGDEVASGEAVGLVGSSGASTGPHLHLGLLNGGRARDPGPVLSFCNWSGDLEELL